MQTMAKLTSGLFLGATLATGCLPKVEPSVVSAADVANGTIAKGSFVEFSVNITSREKQQTFKFNGVEVSSQTITFQDPESGKVVPLTLATSGINWREAEFSPNSDKQVVVRGEVQSVATSQGKSSAPGLTSWTINGASW